MPLTRLGKSSAFVVNRMLMRRQRRRGGRRLLPDVLGAVAILAALSALLGIYRWRSGETLSGVAYAIDGDSLRLAGRELRLEGLDAPELNQLCERDGRSYECGRAARRALALWLVQDNLTCRTNGEDRYGRALARCTAGGADINAALVREGLAVSFGAYLVEEEEARTARRGLWAGTFERPADWRRAHPRP